MFTKVGGNLVSVQLYENTISSGFLFGVYNREGIEIDIALDVDISLR